MSRRVKDMLTQELKSHYAETEGALLVDLTGLDAIATHELRGELEDKSARLEVIRNRLAKRAFVGHALEPLAKHFVGPCALVTGPSTVDVARLLLGLRRKYRAVQLKEGLIEGDTETRLGEAIARLKSLSELRSELAGAVGGPAGRLAGSLRGVGGIIAGCVKALVQKLEASGAPA